MSDLIESISRSLSTDVQTLNAVSHNVANISTPGFRARTMVKDFGLHAGLQPFVSQKDGAFVQTNRNLDVALRGEGFFTVERGGETLLARAGAFRLDAQGRLINGSGDPVLGQAGIIVLSGEQVRIDARGGIWEGERMVDQLRIVSVADVQQLHATSGGAYAYSGEFDEWQGALIQGGLERSNVDASEQTVRLMETTRHAESVQRAISIYDKTMDIGINRLGE